MGRERLLKNAEFFLSCEFTVSAIKAVACLVLAAGRRAAIDTPTRVDMWPVWKTSLPGSPPASAGPLATGHGVQAAGS
jgi:hypothetical protein